VPVRVDVAWGEASSAAYDPPYSVADVQRTGVPQLLRGVGAAWGVWCNVTGQLTCFPRKGCGNYGRAGAEAGGATSVGATSAAREFAASAATEAATAAAAGNDESAGGTPVVGGSGSVCTQSFSGSWRSVTCNDDLNLVNYLVCTTLEEGTDT
jgi:hypothetical protein